MWSRWASRRSWTRLFDRCGLIPCPGRLFLLGAVMVMRPGIAVVGGGGVRVVVVVGTWCCRRMRRGILMSGAGWLSLIVVDWWSGRCGSRGRC